VSEPEKGPPESAPQSAAPAPEAPPPPGTAPGPAQRPPSPPSGPALQSLVAWAALAVALAAAAFTWPRLAGLESEAARRLQALDQHQLRLDTELGQARDELRDSRNRIAVLESKVLEAAGLQAQVEKLYRNLADDSVDVMLAETESALALAAQQLALGSNPQATLRALQGIDARLARQDDPSLGGVRRALAADIERVKAWPVADVGALAQRLDGVLATADQLGLLATVRAPAAAAAPRRAAQVPAGAPRKGEGAGREEAATGRGAAAATRAGDAAAAGLSALRDELQQLFRVRRIDAPEAALLAPEQAYFLRENLRLLLLNARLSLLMRNDALFHGDVGRAVAWLRKYFDPEQRLVADALAQLDQMRGAKLALEPPTLADSLAAVRAARSARDTPPTTR